MPRQSCYDVDELDYFIAASVVQRRARNCYSRAVTNPRQRKRQNWLYRNNVQRERETLLEAIEASNVRTRRKQVLLV